MGVRVKSYPGASECRSIRQLLLLVRAKNGWPAVRVAKALKVSPTSYKAWEKGQRPKIEHYERLSRYCAVPVVRLVQLATTPESA
jgi:transcriptional regulator with XRE-family HTH domain